MPILQAFPLGAYVVETLFLGERAAFALGDGTVRLARGPAVEEARAHGGAILTAIRSSDGEGILTGGDDGRLVLTRSDGQSQCLAERKRKWIDQLAVGPGGAIAFAVGKDAVLRLADGSERVFAQEKAVGGLAFAPKGARLAVAHYGGVSLWWINNDSPPIVLKWKGAHGAMTFAPDGRFVVTSMPENALHGWRLADGQDMRMSGYPSKPKSMAWTVKGKYLATSGAEMAVLWPFQSKEGPQGKTPLQIAPRQALVTKVVGHPSLEAIAIGYADGAIVLALLDRTRPAMLRQAQEDGAISALAFDQSGRRLAFGGESGAAGIIEL